MFRYAQCGRLHVGVYKCSEGGEALQLRFGVEWKHIRAHTRVHTHPS